MFEVKMKSLRDLLPEVNHFLSLATLFFSEERISYHVMAHHIPCNHNPEIDISIYSEWSLDDGESEIPGPGHTWRFHSQPLLSSSPPPLLSLLHKRETAHLSLTLYLTKIYKMKPNPMASPPGLRLERWPHSMKNISKHGFNTSYLLFYPPQ